MNIDRKRLLLWLYILLACGVLRGVFFVLHINSPLGIEEDHTVIVENGDTFNRIVTRLGGEEILASPFDIRLYGKLSGLANDIKAGEYILSPGMNSRDLLRKLAAGDVLMHQVILLEGWTLSQALSSIQSQEGITVTIDASDPEILEGFFDTENYPEGLIFPDTYNFSRGTADREILARAREQMSSILAGEWADRDVGLPYNSPDEALIMASIIEKETAMAAEREQIAGVFVRRLQRGMRLQTDPTVIYGLGASYDGNLTRADLQRPSPYNTYLNAGLPPTPIALAGRESIHASLHPDQSDTLYFVARGDGSHYFSSTLEEHERAVEQYQLGQSPQQP